MKHLKISTVGIYTGLAAAVLGLLMFSVSWYLWDVIDGPLPGYEFVLAPGNLTLIYIWHPLFTEEINFWPKLFLLMLGQFVVVSATTASLIHIFRKLSMLPLKK